MSGKRSKKIRAQAYVATKGLNVKKDKFNEVFKRLYRAMKRRYSRHGA